MLQVQPLYFVHTMEVIMNHFHSEKACLLNTLLRFYLILFNFIRSTVSYFIYFRLHIFSLTLVWFVSIFL